jgi:geranylgeranyl diphosphate synthase, type II
MRSKSIRLKTSPAFEAAMYAGLRMAGPTTEYEEFLPQFARQIGVGFQILNDLKDWRGDGDNKLIAGQDALSLRPTVLLALAYQSASEAERQTLHQLVESQEPDGSRIDRLREIFEKHKVFDKAEVLIEKSRSRAEALVDDLDSAELKQLCYFLIDTVLAPKMCPNRICRPIPSWCRCN